MKDKNSTKDPDSLSWQINLLIFSVIFSTSCFIYVHTILPPKEEIIDETTEAKVVIKTQQPSVLKNTEKLKDLEVAFTKITEKKKEIETIEELTLSDSEKQKFSILEKDNQSRKIKYALVAMNHKNKSDIAKKHFSQFIDSLVASQNAPKILTDILDQLPKENFARERLDLIKSILSTSQEKSEYNEMILKEVMTSFNKTKDDNALSQHSNVLLRAEAHKLFLGNVSSPDQALEGTLLCLKYIYDQDLQKTLIDQTINFNPKWSKKIERELRSLGY